MSTSPTITCPKCKTPINLDESLAGPLLEATRKQAAEDLAAANKRADDAVTKARIEAAASGRLAGKLEAEEFAKEQQGRITSAQQAAHRAVEEAEELRSKLTTAQEAQAAAIKHERELADKERELDLTIETRVTQEVNAAASRAETAVDERYKLKLLEKDTLLQSLETKVNDLQTKLTQGSQQLQGEVQELDLEAQLKAKFPFDIIMEVAKGVNGADCSQVVSAPSGAATGLILWESKRTKHWSDGWLTKLREDGRKAHADLLVIVSAALPEELSAQNHSFTCLDGVWVCSLQTAIPLALALRAVLLAAHNVKQTQAGMATKAESVYAYVTGPQFKHRVEALVEAFTTMQEDLTSEKKATQRQWSKREVQIERVLTSTSGMFGDLQGIAGKALPSPAGLELSDGGGE
jgi:hypothetical protein